jgi:hypothetical protein
LGRALLKPPAAMHLVRLIVRECSFENAAKSPQLVTDDGWQQPNRPELDKRAETHRLGKSKPVVLSLAGRNA